MVLNRLALECRTFQTGTQEKNTGAKLSKSERFKILGYPFRLDSFTILFKGA